MNKEEVLSYVEKQREFFKSGKTLDVKFRKKYLKNLKICINNHLSEIYEALRLDLNKDEYQAYMAEVGIVLSEISYHLKHINKFAKPRRKKTPLFQVVGSSYEVPVPYGNVLIMSPWNYPFLLSVDPLVEALSAGNSVILKTSEYSPNVNKIIEKILEEVFPAEYVKLIHGGYEENQVLINTQFDYVFFTGSKKVGKIVYEAQAKYMTPVSLELGGKSPAIVDETCALKVAAKRIAWGKILNSGQTCVAPDYLFVHKSIHDQFISLLKEEFKKQCEDPFNNNHFCKMINQHHYERVKSLINEDKVVFGGTYNDELLKIAPTILDNVTYEDKIMSEEIFGPVLPIIVYEKIEECYEYILNNEVPLALYIFSKDKKKIKYIHRHIPFGGGCVNDTVMHLATTELGFGGFKHSGIGSYHGKYGFETFSHYKSIMDKATFIDLPMRYKPYKKIYDIMIKFFLK